MRESLSFVHVLSLHDDDIINNYVANIIDAIDKNEEQPNQIKKCIMKRGDSLCRSFIES